MTLFGRCNVLLPNLFQDSLVGWCIPVLRACSVVVSLAQNVKVRVVGITHTYALQNSSGTQTATPGFIVALVSISSLRICDDWSSQCQRHSFASHLNLERRFCGT